MNFFVFVISFSLTFSGGRAAADVSFPDETKIEAISRQKEWRLLMHYEEKRFGGVQSKVDGPGFFLAENGSTDPKAELRSSLDELIRGNRRFGSLKELFPCAFPARTEFLKNAFQLKLPETKCDKIEEFLKKFNAESATLVFSSAYPNNPGSMFGHTFLRINSKVKPGQVKLDALDYGVGYAALVSEEENVLLYMALGLFGGYRGRFSMEPYFAKLAEYSDGESRDLYEYDLTLTEQEVTQLLKHLYEIETNSYLDYFFFDENCALQLLDAIRVVKPDWNFGRFGPYVTPAESIKRVVRVPGAVKSIRFRPSLRKRLGVAVNLLSPSERVEFNQLKQKGVSAGYSVQSANSMDAYLLLLSYQIGKDKNHERLPEKTKALLERSRLPVSDFNSKIEAKAAALRESEPQFGHSTYRAGLVVGQAQGNLFRELQFKFALHDLLNPDLGYSPFSQVDFPGIRIRSNHEKIRIEQIEGVAVTSLYPLTSFDQKASWATSFSVLTPRDLECGDCHVLHFDFGGGMALPVLSSQAIFYSLAFFQLEAGELLTSRFRLVPRIDTSFIASLSDRLKAQLTLRMSADVLQSSRRQFFTRGIFETAYVLKKDFEVRASLSQALFKEAALSLLFYF